MWLPAFKDGLVDKLSFEPVVCYETGLWVNTNAAMAPKPLWPNAKGLLHLLINVSQTEVALQLRQTEWKLRLPRTSHFFSPRVILHLHSHFFRTMSCALGMLKYLSYKHFFLYWGSTIPSHTQTPK